MKTTSYLTFNKTFGLKTTGCLSWHILSNMGECFLHDSNQINSLLHRFMATNKQQK